MRTPLEAAPPLTVVETVPGGLREQVRSLLDRGARIGALFAAESRAGRPEVRCVASLPGERVLLRCPVVGGEVPSLRDLAPALDWDEREARDLFGVRFAGHEPHRALVAHPDDLSAWTTPVVGADVHQIAVGPIHAGIIESGHFRFHAVGESVLHLDIRLFYKHRGLQSVAEGREPPEALRVVQRACAACAVANAVAYSHAVEEALGLWPDDELRRARTLLLELERLYNHLNDIGAICAGVGLAAGAMMFAGLKERAQRINRILTGHRFLFDSVAVGESALEIDEPAARSIRRDIDALREESALAWTQLLFDNSLRDRTMGTGVLSKEDARRLGTVGPAARASGIVRDAREHSPRLWYPGFSCVLPPEPSGDVAARMEARAVELDDVFRRLDGLLAEPVRRGRSIGAGLAGGHGVGVVESPRGETLCAVEIAGDRVRRVHLRTGSYANWPSVARAATGALVPDFPLINKSFELCYACVDR
jgi:Ni,Fe-hydrogenase III large subunit